MTPQIADLLGNISPDVKSYIDGAWYLEVCSDVASAEMDPAEHYLEYGWKEGRDPAPWFSAKWYLETVLQPLAMSDIDPFAHYLSVGARGGFTPAQAAEKDAEKLAEKYFDAEFYLEQNEDVAQAKVDPWQHFLREGWKEGRNPSGTINLAAYTEQYIDTEMPPRNPLLHYVIIGETLGHQLNIGWEGSSGSAGPMEAFFKSLDAKSAVKDVSSETLLLNSTLFDARYYAQTANIAGTKAELVADFLSKDPWTCPNPSSEFSCTFYMNSYLPLFEADTNPLVHYLTKGHRQGFFPNAAAALDDAQLIETTGAVSSELYQHTMQHLPENAPVLDYVLKGQHYGAKLNHDVDDVFVKRVYGALWGDIGAPLAFFLRNKDKAWMFGSLDHLGVVSDLIRKCAFFDRDFYMKQAGITDETIDVAAHYAIIGVRERIACHPEFDTDFYLTTYPDVAEVAVTPVLHYAENGRDEGRLGNSRVVETIIEGGVAPDPDRETIWVFSHEATRTGAPIVALNVVRMMSETYNVVSWIGADGPLTEEFAECSVAVVEGWSGTDGIRAKIHDLAAKAACKFAIVNSVVCHPVMPALRLERVPVVSLIHEFANYVYPFGATARMAISSDVAVFPADIVSQAALNELDKIGAGPPPENFKVRPQGYNSGSMKSAPITAQEVLDFIRVDRNNPRTRIMFGAGYVQPRKGVDLFLQSARHLLDDPDHDWHFVWVGGNYHPETDMVTSVYIEHQINNTVARHFSFFEEQPSLEPFWEIADVLFLSSRLDPYPNVALDALARAVPVVCFNGATGIAALEEPYPWAVRAVDYADVWSAAQACRNFAGDIKTIRDRFRGADGEVMMDLLSFENYISDLSEFAEEARDHEAKVSNLERDLADLDAMELRRAVRCIPEALRYNAPTRSDVQRRMLAEYVTPGRLTTGLSFDTEEKLHTLSEPGLEKRGLVPWSAEFTSIVPVQAKPRLLHLHVASVEVLNLLLEAGVGFKQLLDRVPVELTASSPITVEGLQDLDLAGAKVFERPVFDPISHLRELAKDDAYEQLAFCDVDLMRSSSFRPILRGLETHVVKMFGLGAMDGCFEQTGCSAVLAPMQLGDRSFEAENALTGIGPLCYAPRFAGSYRRDTLNAFFEQEWDNLQGLSAGFAKDVTGSIAALSFADYLSQGPNLTYTILPNP